ncbi:two-component system regulatory protein YycI [Paenibacillus thailandensis]|uniref:Two-component system regulatory protein YycI n=1 Tax=Paenibacillus thailandensis TaxID=393250 RepID=A0ABW5R1K6_9BACL
MDWGRAKTVLIFAFLLLNILLGFQLMDNLEEQLSTSNTTAELPAETLSLMKQKGIELTAALPLETPKLHDLTYSIRNEKEAAEEKPLQTPVDTRIIFSPSELAEQLGSQIPELDQYVFDSMTSTDHVFVLYRRAEGRPMFDVRLELLYSNQKITAYRQVLVDLNDGGDSAKQTVLSAAQVVQILADKYLPNNSVITDVELGYHGQIFDSETQVAAPTWRILLEDGPPYYVDAISGKVAADSGQQPES